MRQSECVRTVTARKYVSEHPDWPTLTLAKRLAAFEPKLFRDSEDARSVVRDIRGARGKYRLKELADKSLVRPAGTQTDRCPVAFSTYAEPWEPFRLDIPGTWGVLSDIHIPYHDRKAVEVAVNHLKKLRPVGILLNGDLTDHYHASRWQPDPRRRNFPEEIKAGRQFIAWLRGQFPKAELVWKEGNHEERLENYLKVNAPILLGLDCLSLPELYQASDLDVQPVNEKRPVKLGNLMVLHGHEYKFAIQNPVNPARGLFLRAKILAMCGHFHQSAQHSERNADSKVIRCWSTGCLCDLHPEYLPLNNWSHGFAVVDVAGDGEFQVKNHVILGSKVF